MEPQTGRASDVSPRSAPKGYTGAETRPIPRGYTGAETRPIDSLTEGDAAQPAGPSQRRASLLDRWYTLAAPPSPAPNATPTERDLARRGRLAATILLVLLGVLAVMSPMELGNTSLNPPVLHGVLGLIFVVALISIVLNRRGHVAAAGWLLAGTLFISIAGSVALTPTAALTLVRPDEFAMLLAPELIAAALLPPAAILVVALSSAIFIVGDLTLQPPSPQFAAIVQANHYALMERALLVHMFVALVTYLWSRSMYTSLRQLDFAKRVAAMERLDAEHKRELQEGVRQILSVHVALANGDFGARVPHMRDTLLWRLGNSLNMLITRLERLAYVDLLLKRERDEAARVAQALYAFRQGYAPNWPTPTGIPLDAVTAALREVLADAQLVARREASVTPLQAAQTSNWGRPHVLTRPLAETRSTYEHLAASTASRPLWHDEPGSRPRPTPLPRPAPLQPLVHPAAHMFTAPASSGLVSPFAGTFAPEPEWQAPQPAGPMQRLDDMPPWWLDPHPPETEYERGEQL